MLDVEALLEADLVHRVGVGLPAGLLERRLPAHRGAVDEERDHRRLDPRVHRVVEAVQELALALGELVEHLVAGLHAEQLGGPVEQLAVADLVLDLRAERELAVERRRLADERALEVGAHDLRVRVELDHPRRRLAVLLRHVVLRAERPGPGALLDGL